LKFNRGERKSKDDFGGVSLQTYVQSDDHIQRAIRHSKHPFTLPYNLGLLKREPAILCEKYRQMLACLGVKMLSNVGQKAEKLRKVVGKVRIETET